MTGSPVLLLALLALSPVPVQEPESSSPERAGIELLNLPKSRLAIGGYDPVAYFPEGGGEPAKGKQRFQTTWRGVTYRFANEANLERFLVDPDRYEPAYGGWCAWAMVDDDRVEVDPKSFLIQDGEVLLFFDGVFADTRKRWLKRDVDDLRTRADRNWSAYHAQPERDLSGWVLEDGVALGGMDPTAYARAEPVATPGSPEIVWTYKSITYRFANEAGRAAFRERPWAFEPGVGGLDPVALAAGERSAGDPELFLRRDGRTWLFANADNRTAFEADPELESAARTAWRRPGPR